MANIASVQEPFRPDTAFLSEALQLPQPAILYETSRRLTALYAEHFILQGHGHALSLAGYAAAGLCEMHLRPELHSQLFAYPGGRTVHYSPANAWFTVSWQGHLFELLVAQPIPFQQSFFWLIAQEREAAESFLIEVNRWNTEVHGEILVFEAGQWSKSEALFESIRKTTFDNLTLPPGLKRELQRDIGQFFDSEALYRDHGLPWKRGILLVGPPGNGKTHAVKAIINSLQCPCLYVKSFDIPGQGNQIGVRQVFERARRNAPCVVVLEDLDSLIDAANRSFFLNELDGFAANDGIVVLATTNHPERLDPAILNRPSRFDRKYHFELPALAERLAFVAFWNGTLQPTLRLEEEQIPDIVEKLEGFSFAYIRELFLSSMMRWLHREADESMAQIMLSQVETLREQMQSGIEEAAQPSPGMPHGIQMHHPISGSFLFGQPW